MFSVCRQYTTCSVHARATDRQIARKKERRTSSREWTKIMTVNLPRRNFWKVAFKTRNFQKCWPLNFLSLSLSLVSDNRWSIDDRLTEWKKQIYPSCRSFSILSNVDNVGAREKKMEGKSVFFLHGPISNSSRQISLPSPPNRQSIRFLTELVHPRENY